MAAQSALQYRLTFTHSCTHSHTETASGSGAVRVRRRLAQGPLHTQIGGARDRTSNLQAPASPLCLLSPMRPHYQSSVCPPPSRCVLTLPLCPPENARSDQTAGADPDHPDSPYPGGGARDDPEGVRRHPLVLQGGGQHVPLQECG